MKITLVKKILENGNECKKCIEVTERLKENDEMKLISEVVYADERDATSEGFILAQKHNVDVAPFFVVNDGSETKVYKSYFQFRKDILGKITDDVIEEKPQETDPNEDLYWM